MPERAVEFHPIMSLDVTDVREQLTFSVNPYRASLK
jgi:hypothetical protein